MGMPYILVTAARNEDENIERLFRSISEQSLKPEKWVIVNDGSTDRTGDIVSSFADKHDWIEMVQMPEHRDRQFAAKVFCFNAGYDLVKSIDHEIIANIDADVSFDEEYCRFLIQKFEEDPNLGVAGTPFVEDDGYSSIKDSFEGERHVAGGCQFFRRVCFEQINGYTPNKAGGIDWIAVTTARMRGWRTHSFKEKVFHHHRSLGTGESNKIKSDFSYGKKDYYLGNHPVWEVFRILYRLTKKPYILGGLTYLLGFCVAAVTDMERPISKELMRFHRAEQMIKLKAIIVQTIRFKKFKKYDLNN